MHMLLFTPSSFSGWCAVLNQGTRWVGALRWRVLLLAQAVAALAGCAALGPAPQEAAAVVPTQWQAPLPHQGSVGALSQWWQQQGDALLVSWIEAAQAASPTVAQALARVESARAQRTQASAALQPQLDASLSASRSLSQPLVPVATSQSAGLQAQWEIDLWGANRANRQAADAQWQGAQAQWHDARVSVAAEVANAYYGLTTCHALLALAQQDMASRQESARLTALNAQAGFTSTSGAALARINAADGHNRWALQQAACDVETKALVALTGVPEPALRAALQPVLARGTPVQAPPLAVHSVPAQTLAQRPDVLAAERELGAVSAQIGSAQAQRYPRLSLSGSIGALRYRSESSNTDMDTWSFGPLALTLPLWDGGQRQARVEAAQANYAQALASYRAKVRQAVREVEEALVYLHSTESREQDADIASAGYVELVTAAQARYQQGLSSALDLEETKRMALAAQSARLSLALERSRAWVALYRALGGGFTPESVSAPAASTPQQPSAQ